MRCFRAEAAHEYKPGQHCDQNMLAQRSMYRNTAVTGFACSLEAMTGTDNGEMTECPHDELLLRFN